MRCHIHLGLLICLIISLSNVDVFALVKRLQLQNPVKEKKTDIEAFFSAKLPKQLQKIIDFFINIRIRFSFIAFLFFKMKPLLKNVKGNYIKILFFKITLVSFLLKFKKKIYLQFS